MIFIPFLIDKTANTLYDFLNAILVLMAIVSTTAANSSCSYTQLHMRVSHVPHICTLSCYFVWFQSSDNQGWTVLGSVYNCMCEQLLCYEIVASSYMCAA